MRTATPNKYGRSGRLWSNSAQRRCMTKKTSWARSSTSDCSVPRRRKVRCTYSNSARKPLPERTTLERIVGSDSIAFITWPAQPTSEKSPKAPRAVSSHRMQCGHPANPVEQTLSLFQQRCLSIDATKERQTSIGDAHPCRSDELNTPQRTSNSGSGRFPSDNRHAQQRLRKRCWFELRGSKAHGRPAD